MFNTKDVSTPNSQSDRQESGVLIRVKFLNRIDEIIKTSRLRGVLIFIYNMKLIEVLKNILFEGNQLIDKFNVDGEKVNILYNDHSNTAINPSKYGRQPIEDISSSMVDILDIIVDLSNDILDSPPKIKNKDHSILVKDYMIGVDYHFWVTKSKKNELFLTINTSISHPSSLPKNQNDKKIIITKTGDTIIKEQIDSNNFTKIVRGDIIIYII